MMRMIDSFARPWLQRITSGNYRAFGRPQRIEHRLRDTFGPPVRRERLAVDGNVDASLLLVNGHGDAVTRMWPGGTKKSQLGCNTKNNQCSGKNENAHVVFYARPVFKPLPARHRVRGNCREAYGSLPRPPLRTLSPDRTAAPVPACKKHSPGVPAWSRCAPPQSANEYPRLAGCAHNQ